MTREKADLRSYISIFAAIGTLMVVLIIGARLYQQEVRVRDNVQPRDVFEELQVVKAAMKLQGEELNAEIVTQGEELNAEIVKLRESVNHSKEIASETKKRTDALAESLNAQIASLQKELRELNGKK